MSQTAAPSVHDRILYAATENNALLKTLAETDYAPAAVQQNTSYINSLTQQLKQLEKSVWSLDMKRIREQEEHEKYRDSTMRRLAYKISGKKGDFEEKAKKEEREYFEAVQKHSAETKCLSALQTSLREAQETQKELEAANLTHKSAKEALQRLYHDIFQGPTPAFPEEDAAEQAVTWPQQQFSEVQQRLSAESQVLNILNTAQDVMVDVLRNMNKAESASQADVWGLGGSYADMAERSALARAHASVQQIQMLMMQAQNLNRGVGSLGPMNVAQGNFMSDILFDNVFTDLSFHRKIQESTVQIVQASRRLRGEIDKSRNRIAAFKAEADDAARRLNAARENLERVRRAIFDSVAGGLPEYQA